MPMTKKQLIRLGIGVLLILVSFFLGNGKLLPEDAQVPPTATPSAIASPLATPEASHGGELATVVSVVDGDTIKIEGGEVVRYIGVNTPETVAPNKPVECFGKEASSKNKELVQGKTVELEKDVSQRDRYGRLLRFIWIGDMLINEVLVREGYAQVSTYPPDVKYQARFVEAQRLAVAEKKGLWSGDCPLPVTPTPKEAEPTP